MPPYSKIESRTPLLISVPRCAWCDDSTTYKCKGCGKRTCSRCLVEFDYGRCVHRRVVPVSTTGWGTPCPNRPCTESCTLCNGRNMLWSHRLIQKYAPEQIKEAP